MRRIVITARHEEEQTIFSVDGQTFGSIEGVTEHVHGMMEQAHRSEGAASQIEIVVEQS